MTTKQNLIIARRMLWMNSFHQVKEFLMSKGITLQLDGKSFQEDLAIVEAAIAKA